MCRETVHYTQKHSKLLFTIDRDRRYTIIFQHNSATNNSSTEIFDMPECDYA